MVVMTSSVIFEVTPAGFVILPTILALFRIYLYTVGAGADVMVPLAGRRCMGRMKFSEVEGPMPSLAVVGTRNSSVFTDTVIVISGEIQIWTPSL